MARQCVFMPRWWKCTRMGVCGNLGSLGKGGPEFDIGKPKTLPTPTPPPPLRKSMLAQGSAELANHQAIGVWKCRNAVGIVGLNSANHCDC